MPYVTPARMGCGFRSRTTRGAAIELAFKAPRVRHPPVVAICDISGSMSDYTRVFLHFLHALGEQRGHVHTFLFGTRLTNVTRALRHKDPDEALAACSAGVEDWSGGTRIATSLHDFNRLWSRRVLGGGATVLLFTDGLERDGRADLAREMERLKKSCRRLIWLNPLLRYDRFEARAQGIRAMLPFVDEFRPVHDLASIKDLVQALSGESGSSRTRGRGSPALRGELRLSNGRYFDPDLSRLATSRGAMPAATVSQKSS